MAQPQSVGVFTNEIDLTTIVPSVATTDGAFAGVFRWGPLDSRVRLGTETDLVTRFLTPTNFNAESWFSVANFMGYGASCYVSRAGDYTGNSVPKSFVGNSSNLAIESGTNILKTTNSTNLSVGMILFYSNASGVADSLTSASPPIIAAITNSTAIQLTEDATANVAEISTIFRENIVFSAVAQETRDYSIDWDQQIVLNDDDYTNKDGLFDDSVMFVARYAGAAGDSIRIAQCDSPTQFASNTALAPNAQINATTSLISATVGSANLVFSIAAANTANSTHITTANALAGTLASSMAVGDLVQVGNSRVGYQYLKVETISTIANNSGTYVFTVGVDDEYKGGSNVAMTALQRYWEFYNRVDKAPATSSYVTQFGNSAAKDEIHVVVVDELGKFSGSPGTVLEVHKAMSRATDAKTADNAGNYYKDVINQQSDYIWYANDRSTAQSATAEYIASSTATHPLNVQMYGGSDGPDEANVSLGTLVAAWDQFKSAEDVDVSLLLNGKARGEGVSSYTTLANYITQNICEIRTDCLSFSSPDKSFVVNNRYSELDDLVSWRAVMADSSYNVMDSGYKYQYDRYNDVFRWIPLNGDIAGLCARTDQTNDAWWSPAGFKRGQIKNVTRLSWSPRQSDRDILYPIGINPVVSFPNSGTILYGDKTALNEPSAFDRINVRRLFIVLRKAISRMAKVFLFDFNDDFTRAQFRSVVNPYLKDIQGRRGVEDFFVKCDAENNTGQVRMRHEFIGDIYIKPAYSINFIRLNFIAVRSDVAFSEVIGRFG